MQGHPLRLRGHLRAGPRQLPPLHVPVRLCQRGNSRSGQAGVRLRPEDIPVTLRDEDGGLSEAAGVAAAAAGSLSRFGLTSQALTLLNSSC